MYNSYNFIYLQYLEVRGDFLCRLIMERFLSRQGGTKTADGDEPLLLPRKSTKNEKMFKSIQ